MYKCGAKYSTTMKKINQPNWVKTKGPNPLDQFPRSFPEASPQQVGMGKSPLCLLCRVVSQIPLQ